MGWNCVNNLSRKLYNNRDKSNLKITARFVVNDSTFDNFAKNGVIKRSFWNFIMINYNYILLIWIDRR